MKVIFMADIPDTYKVEELKANVIIYHKGDGEFVCKRSRLKIKELPIDEYETGFNVCSKNVLGDGDNE